MFDAGLAEIGDAGFQLGAGCFAIRELDIEKTVEQRNDDIVILMGMPSGSIAALFEPPFRHAGAGIVDKDAGEGCAVGGFRTH